MNKRELNGVPWDIVDGAEGVIEVEGMEMLAVKEIKGKDGACWGRRVDITVGEDCVRGC
jgi:hypothetical protein